MREHTEKLASQREAANRIPPELGLDDHLVAFIDILGFRRQIVAAKSQQDMEHLYLKVRDVQREFEMPEATLDPDEQLRVNDDFGKIVIALSDAVVVVSRLRSRAGAAWGDYDVVAQFLWDLMVAQARCACKGIFVRGGVAHGPFFFGRNVLLSPAATIAYDLESSIADVPMIVLKDSTLNWITNRQKKRFYHDDPNPLLKYFRRHEAAKCSEPVWALDYMRLLVNEQHRGMSEADRRALARARQHYDFERARAISRRSVLKDAAFFLRVHRKAIENAYRTNNDERVRRKYRWLMRYHNASFRSRLPFLRNQKVDLRRYPAPA